MRADGTLGITEGSLFIVGGIVVTAMVWRVWLPTMLTGRSPWGLFGSAKPVPQGLHFFVYLGAIVGTLIGIAVVLAGIFAIVRPGSV